MERSLLIQYMMKDRSLVEFVCETAFNAIKRDITFKTLVSFYVAVMLQYIASLPAITDEVLITILPYILDGLKAKTHPEYQISERATLTSEVLESLFHGIINYHKNRYQMVLCMVHVCQTQETMTEFPRTYFKNLLKIQDLETVVLSVLEKYNAQRFVHLFLIALAKFSDRRPRSSLVLNAILKGRKLPASVVNGVCSAVLERYLEQLKKAKKDSKAEADEYLVSVLQVLHEDYPKELDAALQAQLEESKEELDSETNSQLYAFISKVFNGTRHQPLEESNTTLFLSINHAEASIRLLAVKKLGDILQDKDSELSKVDSEDTFVKDSLLARLQDDDDRIVQEVLKMDSLKRFVAPQDLLSGLVSVISAPASTPETRRLCLVYMLTEFLASNKDLKDKVLSVVLGHLLLVRDFHKASIAVITNIATSDLKDERLIMNVASAVKGLVKKDGNTGNAQQMVTADVALITTLAANLASYDSLFRGMNFYLEGLKGTNNAFRMLSILVLTKTIHHLKGDQQSKAIGLFLPVLLHALKSHTSLKKALKAEAKHGLPGNDELLSQVTAKPWAPSMEVSAIHFSLLSIVSDLCKPKTSVLWMSGETDSEYASILLSLYKTFVGTVNMAPYEPMVQILFDSHLSTDSVEFLCNQWTDASVAQLVRVRSLQLASANLHAFSSQSTSDAPDFQVVVPSLMLALANPVKAMRETAVACLTTISSMYPKVKTSGKKGKTMATSIFKFDSFYGKSSEHLQFLLPEQISAFIANLLKSREEFVTDASYLSKYLIEHLKAAAGDAKATLTAKDSLVSFILSHALAIQRRNTRVELLELLDEIHTPIKLKMLLPVIEGLVQTTFVGQHLDDVNNDLARYLVRCFSPETSSLLEGKSGKYRNAFLQLLKLDTASATNTDTEESTSSFRRLALAQINEAFFAGLSAGLQSEIFAVLIDLATDAPQETVRVVKQVLRDIPLHSTLVISQLANIQVSLVKETTVDEDSHTKRQRRTSPDPAARSVAVETLYRLVTVLELLEYKEISETDKLVAPLFELLSTIMNGDLNNTPVSVEYINQLLLSSLTTFVSQGESGVNAGKLDENMLRVDLVVNCIRATGNPQTHNQALLLMAAIASLYPAKVLHNIMPVFTFMGANVLRQDDNYSFHVIQQTLENIIPPLVAAHRRQSDETKSLVLQVRPIIKVFVDAVFHIPKHRRLRMFSVLISTLGEHEFLHAVVSLIIEKYTERASKGNQTEADSLSEFALALTNQFSAIVQMKAIIGLLDSLQAMPMEKDADVEMDEHLFDISSHNNKQIRQFKLSVLTFSSNVLTAKSFLSKILVQTSNDSGAEAIFETYYLQMAERLLILVGAFSSFVNVVINRKEQSPVVVKFWRGIVKVTYDVLDKVHILLSLPSFVKIMVALFEHKDATIRRKAMVLFNQKITNVPGSPAAVPAAYRDMVVGVSADLKKVIELNEVKGASAEEVAINKQTALMCISTIVRQFGQSHAAEISKIIPVIVGPSGLQHPNEQVQASCLVCLTFMCQELGVRVVPFFPKFMPTVLSILTRTLVSANPAKAVDMEVDATKSLKYNNSVLLQLAVVSHLETVVKTLPQFVSPYVTQILSGTLHPVLAGYEGSDASKLQILQKNKSLLAAMATHITPRILLPPMLGYYETAVKDGKDCLLALFDLVSQTIIAMPRDIIATNYKQIFKFFLGAFDFRRIHGHGKNQKAQEAVAGVEDAIIQAFMQLVMKLNETLFKPLFLKTLDWATTELQVAKAGFQDMQDRSIFFYKLMNSLLESLKSIVTPYYGYVVDNVIEALTGYAKKTSSSYEEEKEGNDTTTIKKRDMDEMWSWLISSLQKCFLHDNDGLWNADRFEKLLHPLVNQLLVTSSVATEKVTADWQVYETRMEKWLVPCLGQLAVTLSNDALWKPLNYQVLLKTREDNKDIRLSALKVLQEFYKRLGEEFLILLPETIPFLAELMEDDDHEVEALTQQIIAEIEVYLGGSLQKYFH
ncbi:HEAT repeat-containing protein 1 [Podila humilis]|nr:HEAT repeat-containing protein 1 [Podila humilis]